MIQLLFDTVDRSAVFLDTVLQLVLLITQGRELLLEFDAIAKQVYELVRILLGRFRRRFEYSCQARQYFT